MASGAYPRAMVRATVFLMMLGAASCAEPLEPAVLAPLCGADGPVRVLELAPDQAMWGYPSEIDGRVYYTVGRPERAGKFPGQFIDRSTWSTGPCGESPRHHADGIHAPFVVEQWPGRVLGCNDESGDILLLDPEGGESKVVFAGAGCFSRWTEYGLVSVVPHDENTGALLLYPYPGPGGEGPEPTVLVDAFQLYNGSQSDLWFGRGDLVHVLSLAGELLRVHLEDLSITVEQTGVRDFDVSDDGRYIVWRGSTVVGGTEEMPAGVVTFQDQDAGFSVSLGTSEVAVNGRGLQWADRGLLVYSMLARERIYRLEDLSFIDLPSNARTYPDGPTEDGHWLLYNIFGSPWLQVVDLEDGMVTPLFASQGQVREEQPGGVVVLDAPTCCINSDGFDEGALWSLRFDGSPPERLASRATRASYRPDPTRLVTGLGIGGDTRGTLALVDLVSGEELRIDDHVFFQSSMFGLRPDPELITYSVMDGARSGVWRARLPAAP